ncbi:hypothetical protein J6590_050219 [Homalodisca vitripennis]|nr:hypothetical protein J6590_050219 [Homalodisca vitripennis]
MAARRNLFSVSGIDISNELNVLEEVSDVSLSDNEERDPSYVPRAASTQESLKITFKQVEDSTGTDNMTWLAVPSTSSQSSLVTSDNFADEEICSTRQGSSTDNEGLTNKRRVVNKVSPKKGRRRQKCLSRQERSKKAKNEGKSYLTYRGTGPPKSPRKPGPNCNCRLKCFIKICQTVRDNKFDEFNAIDVIELISTLKILTCLDL